jgi:hypothetical protein
MSEEDKKSSNGSLLSRVSQAISIISKSKLHLPNRGKKGDKKA